MRSAGIHKLNSDKILAMVNLILTSPTTLIFNNKEYRCASGSGGIKTDKIEGDKATPIGNFGLRYIFYRPDKFKIPPSNKITCQELRKNDGWCDDPNSPKYNTYVQLPYPAGHEQLWRDDEIYDIIIITTHNSNPVIPNNGSAIFIHIARENYVSTEGCIALNKQDLLEILTTATPGSKLVIPEALAKNP